MTTIAEGNWAEVDLAAAPGAEALWEEVARLRDEPVHVIALQGIPPWEPSAEWLRDFALFDLPTVFGFDGELSGAALAVALHCDIRVCGEEASIRAREADEQRLALLSGRAAGRENARAGERENARAGGRESVISAEAALELGLVSRVTPRGQGEETARLLATMIGSRGPIAVQLGKEALWRGLGMPLEQALRFETDLTLLLQTTKDRAEGVAAFLEKRQPTFAGE